MAEDVAAFGAAAERVLGFRPSPSDLGAALGAVSFREAQASSKLSPVVGPRSGRRGVAPYCSATYASFATCPSSCAFLTDPMSGARRGCFVSANFFQMKTMNRIDASARRLDVRIRGTLIGLAEAHVIDRSFPDGVPQDGPGGGRILRIHVAGDAPNAIVARALASAADRWLARGGGAIWSYTHRWRSIPRGAWGSISILASVETVDAAVAAMALGYAAAIVVEKFESEKAYSVAPRARLLPCPTDVPRQHADGRAITCATCGWCFHDRSLLLPAGAIIGFRTHGNNGSVAGKSIGGIAEAATIVRRHLRVL